MKRVLVTGANGQLGKCLEAVSGKFPALDCTFVTKEALDILDTSLIAEIFSNENYSYCINTAAYTNVEGAETETERAFAINAEGAKNMAQACNEHGVQLLHISTDYVFDGTKISPYLETDATNPLSVYGASKLKGEQYIQEVCPEHIILRTSWLYSDVGKNFYTSMVRFAEEKRDLAITTAEMGTPTNAYDLATVCFELISEKHIPNGMYHYSNEGKATWYDFAHAIFEAHGILKDVNLSKTHFFPTKATRPAYSVLSKDKVKNASGFSVKPWKKSLEDMVATIG